MSRPCKRRVSKRITMMVYHQTKGRRSKGSTALPMRKPRARKLWCGWGWYG